MLIYSGNKVSNWSAQASESEFSLVKGSYHSQFTTDRGRVRDGALYTAENRRRNFVHLFRQQQNKKTVIGPQTKANYRSIISHMTSSYQLSVTVVNAAMC